MAKEEKEVILEETTAAPSSEPNNPEEAVHIDQTEGSERYPDVYFDIAPDEITKSEKISESSFIFRCKNKIALQVSILGTDLFRFRYTITGTFPADFSYAIDPNFQSQKVRVQFQEQEKYFTIETPSVTCRIDKLGMKVHLYDQNGHPICQDGVGFKGRRTILKGITELAIHKKAPLEEAYFGLGDKSRSANLRGHLLQNWCTDAFAFNDTSDELYRAIPFYYGLNNGHGYGIFLDNSYRSHFDFDSEKSGNLSFSAAGGEMNYYFINGPHLLAVAEGYMDLTGKPELPPIWTLGFHQCRWSYYPEKRVREIADTFRDKKIPCDAIYLDIDYMDEYRCFTWNKDHFPNPKQLIADLKEDGFKTVVMIDPGIKVDPDYAVYKTGVSEDVFCKRPNGEMMTGPVWPSDCAFPDFTKPETRDWWGPLYDELYKEHDVDGFWNDMNEPAVFKVNSKTFPEDIRHDYDGHPCAHDKAHNIYGQQMSRATQEGLKKLRPERRPFVLTRATFCGGQRFAAAWTGDNVASWDHLQLANRQCQRMSTSGFSFIGTDIGGFVDQPDAELMVRWLQLGIFHPLYRVHSMGNNVDGAAEVDAEGVQKSLAELRLDQEPWSFGEDGEELGRKAIEMRYQLLPCIYTAFWQNCQKGTPMLKPLAFIDQTDPISIKRENEFLFGDHLLVSPVMKPGAKIHQVYLPKGKWYPYQSSAAFAGRQYLNIASSLERIPIFVRAGAVIPRYPVMQHTGERPVETLELDLYFGTAPIESVLYEDAGDDYAYENGVYALRKFVSKGSISNFKLSMEKEGSRVDSYKNYKINVYGLPFKPVKCHSKDGLIQFTSTTVNKSRVYTLYLETGFNEFEFISG